MSAAARIGVLVLTAAGAWAVWLAEVFWVKGWTGLVWLSGFNWSSLPASAIIVAAASYVLAPRAVWRDRLRFLTASVFLVVAAFVVGRTALFQLFGPTHLPPLLGPLWPLALLGAGLAPSIGLAILADRWLVRLRWWTGAAVAVAIAAAIGLAFATIGVFPAPNGSTDMIHAVKMGYPIFWSALLVPLALRLGVVADPS